MQIFCRASDFDPAKIRIDLVLFCLKQFKKVFLKSANCTLQL
jgi:hypothetical protein